MKKIFKIHFLVIYNILLLFMPFIFLKKECVTLLIYPTQPGGCYVDYYLNYGLNLLFKADIYNFDQHNSSSFDNPSDGALILSTWLITNFILAVIISGIWLRIKKKTKP